ncbi:MAG: hypothetical protein AMJ75_04875 [Phycisphaerae bacterium SM1_79]|nr:MAG: hypothetical protein AMJ75_04875 [Phycisphaerae bacterium SM1_79]
MRQVLFVRYFSFFQAMNARNEKRPVQTGLLLIARPSSASAVRKDFEENPLLPGGQSLLVSESPIE